MTNEGLCSDGSLQGRNCVIGIKGLTVMMILVGLYRGREQGHRTGIGNGLGMGGRTHTC